jgi:hypothetical protein
MFRTLARLFLLKFLPRRLVPLLTAYEIYRFIQGVRRSGQTDPTRRVTGPRVVGSSPGRPVVKSVGSPVGSVGPEGRARVG